MVTVVPPADAEIVTVVAVDGLTVAIEKVPVAEPAATVIVVLDIEATLIFEDATVTTVPPVGAGSFRVTVPVTLVPPVTDADDSPRLFTTGAWTVTLALPEIVPDAATTVAVPVDEPAVYEPPLDIEPVDPAPRDQVNAG